MLKKSTELVVSSLIIPSRCSTIKISVAHIDYRYYGIVQVKPELQKLNPGSFHNRDESAYILLLLFNIKPTGFRLHNRSIIK